jgi:hypothetical protein
VEGPVLEVVDDVRTELRDATTPFDRRRQEGDEVVREPDRPLLEVAVIIDGGLYNVVAVEDGEIELRRQMLPILGCEGGSGSA